METVNKHPDSANDSVDSFEDAIDNLDLQEDTSNPEDHSKHSYLKKDEVPLNNNVALSNEKCDSTETIAEKNTKNLGILNTIVEDINTANRPMNTEQMSIKTSILPTESDKKDITDKIAIITDDLADFSMNKTKSESAYAVTSDSKIIQDEKITGKDNNIITVEKTALKEDPKIIDKDIVKDSDKEALSCDKNHEFANKSEILIEDPSNELDKEEISYKNDTTSVELLHNHINEKAIPFESEIGSNNETTELDGQEATANQNVELSSEIGTKNEKVEPCSKVDTYNENIEPDYKSPIRKENVEFNSKVDTCKEYLEADNYLETNNEKNPPESKLEKSEDSVDNTDEEGSIKSEREQGDGQGEQDEGKKELELDEDKRNPEYIPKKGSFYEHDTRTLDGFDDDVKKFEEEIAVKNKKKSKSIAAEGRWQHDKYDEIEQCPKSQQEIIDSYGYDIRNEEHPPKARRNRRYGRGPNKYNRNWEDEKAYIKIEYKGPRNSEGRQNKSINDRTRQNKPSTREENYSDFREKQNTSTSNPDIIDNSDKYPPLLHYSDKIGMKAEKGGWAPPPPFSQKNVVHKSKLGGDDDSAKPQGRYDPSNMDQDQPDEREALAVLPSLPPKDLPTIVADKSGPPKQKAFSSLPLNNMPAFVPAPAYRPSLPAKGPSVNIPPNWYLSQNKIERTGPPDSPELSHKDYSKLPGGIAALRGGKRYSVQRQQSLESRSASATAEIDAMTTDETGPPSQALPPTAFYHHPATGPAPPISLPQSSPSHLVFRQSPPPPVKVISADASCYHSHMYSAENPHPISNGAGGAPPMLLPVHFVSPPPAQVPSFNNAQAPIMSYGPQPLQFQPMQPIVSLPPPPQTEVFQPAGGITYYSPQTQAVLQRPALSKRVKSAIPIVPPSEVNNIQQTNLVQQPPNNVVQLSNPIQLSDAVINNAIQQKIQLVPVDNSKKDDNLNN